MAHELFSVAIVERMFPKPEVRRAPGFDIDQWRQTLRAADLQTPEGRKRFIEKECDRLSAKFEDEDSESIA